jgi:hypothetical protein
MKYINFSEDVVVGVDEGTLKAEVISVKNLNEKLEGLQRSLLEFPELSDEELLTWARQQRYPTERFALRETIQREIDKINKQLESITPKEGEPERLSAWR